MGRKAAVVIGVNKTGNLTPLDSAARSAKEMATWLENEGFDVECLTDQETSVTTQQVKDAIKKFVTVPARYHMLLVYFSGHGQWHARTDHWLLSGAPVDNSEAINLDGAMDLAKYSGIPNVVFISDACRSIPDSRAGAVVKGVDGFPNYQDFNILSKIDYFKAASESRSAYEGKIDGETHGVLTYALKSAFETPTPDMIREVTEGGENIKVIPNRKLEGYLQSKVSDVLDLIGNNLTQQLDANVPSNDDIYISRVLGPVPSDEPTHLSLGHVSIDSMTDSLSYDDEDDSVTLLDIVAPELTVGQDAAITIERDLSTRGLGAGGAVGIDTLSVSVPDTETQLSTRMPQGVVDHFESETGFLVHGAVVIKGICTVGQGNSRVEVLEHGNGHDQPAVIRVWADVPAVSVLIKLDNGRSAVLAGLFGYLGHASFDQHGLENVSYVPSTNNERWQSYEYKKDKIDRLRALVAVAVDHNSFNIGSESDAESLAEQIRVEKSIDPTLGLYAAHAYNQASKERHIASVLEYMYYDLHADLFDVRVLSSRIKNKPVTSDLVVPFCPMLTQTWNILRPRGIKLPDVLNEAENYLCNSLWTTFEPEATDKIIQAIKSGELI